MREAAEDVRDLERSEHLVLFGFRLTALGHADCPVLRRTFGGFLGGDGDGAIGDLLVFTRLLGAVGRRPVRLHTPGCCGLTCDERGVLTALACAQASLIHGDERRLEAALAALLDAPPPHGCLMAAQRVAAIFSVHGLDLPERACGEAEPEPAPRATVH